MNNSNQIIKEKAEEFVKERGMELIEFKIFSSPEKYIVRCLVDYPQGGITIEECADINKKLFSFLTGNGVLGNDFVVEVNSPGLDRPLKTHNDFLRVKGEKISLWLNEPAYDKNYLEGKLINVLADKLVIESKDKTREIELLKVKMGKICIYSLGA